jgi:hypothetical protein
MELIALLLFIAFIVCTINKMDAKKTSNEKLEKSPFIVTPNLSVITDNSNLVEKISGYFQKHNIRYWLSEDQKSFRTGFDLDSEGCFDMFVNIHDNHLSFACEVMTQIGDDDVAKTIEITSRINQYYNFGQLNFFFENRVIVFKIVYPLYHNELDESKFRMYFDGALDGARNCRPVINKVLVEGEEPAIAVTSI